MKPYRHEQREPSDVFFLFSSRYFNSMNFCCWLIFVLPHFTVSRGILTESYQSRFCTRNACMEMYFLRFLNFRFLFLVSIADCRMIIIFEYAVLRSPLSCWARRIKLCCTCTLACLMFTQIQWIWQQFHRMRIFRSYILYDSFVSSFSIKSSFEPSQMRTLYIHQN